MNEIFGNIRKRALVRGVRGYTSDVSASTAASLRRTLFRISKYVYKIQLSESESRCKIENRKIAHKVAQCEFSSLIANCLISRKMGNIFPTKKGKRITHLKTIYSKN